MKFPLFSRLQVSIFGLMIVSSLMLSPYVTCMEEKMWAQRHNKVCHTKMQQKHEEDRKVQ